jgi:hypothetical protein
VVTVRAGDVVGWALLTVFVGTLCLGLLAGATAGLGSGYWLTSEAVRGEHPLHLWLRPGGPVGVLFGVVGASLMTAMLGYTLRKLGGSWLWFLGPIPWWLRFHIACGVFGPLFIVEHVAFVWPEHLVAIGFWCMVLVATSGVFGRYVYGHLPRSAAGKELDRKSGRGELHALRARLVAETADASGGAVGAAVALVEDFEREAHSLVGLVLVDLDVRARLGLVDAHLHRAGLAGPHLRSARSLLRGQLVLKRDLEALKVTTRLFRWWHLFHNPLARAMYLIVALHVLEAVLFGGALAQLAELVPG